LKVHDAPMSDSSSTIITTEVLTWPGTHGAWGERGEWSLRVGRREIGHLHGDRMAHFGFPRQLGARLHAEGRVAPHPVMPDNPGWAARSIASPEDVREVLELLRLNYDRVVAKHGVPEPVADASGASA
jgi:hypothetical protein